MQHTHEDIVARAKLGKKLKEVTAINGFAQMPPHGGLLCDGGPDGSGQAFDLALAEGHQEYHDMFGDEAEDDDVFHIVLGASLILNMTRAWVADYKVSEVVLFSDGFVSMDGDRARTSEEVMQDFMTNPASTAQRAVIFGWYWRNVVGGVDFAYCQMSYTLDDGGSVNWGEVKVMSSEDDDFEPDSVTGRTHEYLMTAFGDIRDARRLFNDMKGGDDV